MKIGLLWHSASSDNLGVGALTESQIAIIRAAAKRAGRDISFCVFGTSGSRAIGPVSEPLELGDRLSWKRILVGRSRYLAQLRSCDLVLDIGEGDSFTDIYGLERFFYQTATKAAVVAMGKPLVLSPQTIGPFDRGWTRRIASWLMRRATRVYARDGLSRAYLDSLGIQANAAEAIDVAFRLPYEKVRHGDDGVTRVGINVSGLLYAGGYSRDNQFGLKVDYAALTDALVARFTALPNCEVHLVGHVLSDSMAVEDDYRAGQEIARKFPAVKVAEKFNTPSQAKSYIAGLDYFTGARMHACIAAFSSGVPVTPLAYSRKFTGLFNSLGYQQVADCKALTTAEVEHLVMQGFADRQRLAEQVATGRQEAARRLQAYEDYLVDCIRQAA